MKRCIGVEWGLEQISDFFLLTNEVIKVIYSYFESPPKIVEHNTTNRCTYTSGGNLYPEQTGMRHFDQKSSTQKSGNLPKIETQKSGNPKR